MSSPPKRSEERGPSIPERQVIVSDGAIYCAAAEYWVPDRRPRSAALSGMTQALAIQSLNVALMAVGAELRKDLGVFGDVLSLLDEIALNRLAQAGIGNPVQALGLDR